MLASRNAVPVILGVVAVIATGFTSSGAQAQQASLLEEIVVTARMRAENLQEVPVTVSAFTADDIDKIGVSNMRDYAQLVPNFFLVETQNSSFTFVNIRGITQMRNLDPSVAIMVDGVLSTNPISMSQELFDIEQIEVLKGPQGALYGRSAVGGAINITTKRPTNEFEGFVRAGLGDGDASKLQAAISGPLVEDRVFGRLSASFYDADGWRDNVVVGRKSDPVENKSIRGRLIFTPNDTFEADLRFSRSEDDLSALGFTDLAPAWAPFAGDPSISFACGVGIFPAASLQCGAGPVDIGSIAPFTPDNPNAGIFQGDINNTSVPQQSNLIGIDERELMSFSALLKWEFDAGTLTSVTSFGDAEDAAWGEHPPRTQIAAYTNSQWRDTETISQEIRFTSRADQRLRWIVGAYFLETESFLSTTVQRNTLGIDTLDFFVKDNPEPLRCNFAAGFPLPGSPADTPTACVIGFDGDEQDNTAYAVFAQINYDISDTVELSFSGRYDKDEREQTIATPDVFLSFFAAGNPGLVFGAVRKTDFDSFQPKLTVRWTPQDNVMLYASYAEGFRSGGFNRPGIEARANADRGSFPPGFIPEGIFDIYPQQDTASIEGGFKWNSTDGRWVLNGAVFFTEVDDYHTFTFNGQLNGSQIIIPVDEAEINGIELDFTGRLTDALSLNVGVAVNDSEITAESFRGLVGNETPQTPDHTLNIGLQYEDPDGRFFVRGDYQQIGEVFFMPANWVARDELDLINIRAGINLGADQSLQLAIWCDNCTDENYFGEGFNDAGGLFYYGKLRQAGVELTKRF